VFGTREAVTHVRAARGWQINPLFVERLNLDLRQRVAAVGRRVKTLCPGEDGMPQQLALLHVYHNFVRPHASWRQPLAAPLPTSGTGSAKRWRPCTPAMAAGWTDHVWTLQEVLLYRVPPWPQPQTVSKPARGDECSVEGLSGLIEPLKWHKVVWALSLSTASCHRVVPRIEGLT
jgi:hypothetical protein